MPASELAVARGVIVPVGRARRCLAGHCLLIFRLFVRLFGAGIGALVRIIVAYALFAACCRCGRCACSCRTRSARRKTAGLSARTRACSALLRARRVAALRTLLVTAALLRARLVAVLTRRVGASLRTRRIAVALLRLITVARLRARLITIALLRTGLITVTLLGLIAIALLRTRLITVTLLGLITVALLRTRLIAVTLLGLIPVTLLRATAVVLHDGMRFIPAVCGLFRRFWRGLGGCLRLCGLWLLGCGRGFSCGLLRSCFRSGFFLRGFRRRLLRGRFGNGCLRGSLLLGGCFRFCGRLRLRQLVVVSSSGMCGVILIGIEQIAQALHALALFARFALLLLLVK